METEDLKFIEIEFEFFEEIQFHLLINIVFTETYVKVVDLSRLWEDINRKETEEINE